MKYLIKLILITLMMQTFTFAKSSNQCASYYERIEYNLKKFVKYGKENKMELACKFFKEANNLHNILSVYKCNTTVELKNFMNELSSACPKSK